MEYVSFLVPLLILFSMALLIKRALKVSKRKRQKRIEEKAELQEVKKKMLHLHQVQDKLVHNLQLQIHELKKQLSHLNESQIMELKDREACIDMLKKEREMLALEIEALRSSLRALDFRI